MTTPTSTACCDLADVGRRVGPRPNEDGRQVPCGRDRFGGLARALVMRRDDRIHPRVAQRFGESVSPGAAALGEPRIVLRARRLLRVTHEDDDRRRDRLSVKRRDNRDEHGCQNERAVQKHRSSVRVVRGD